MDKIVLVVVANYDSGVVSSITVWEKAVIFLDVGDGQVSFGRKIAQIDLWGQISIIVISSRIEENAS